MPPLQHAAHGLSNVRLVDDLSDLQHRLRSQRHQVRPVQCIHGRVLHLQRHGYLHKLHQHSLRFSRRVLSYLQQSDHGVLQLRRRVDLSVLLLRVRPRRGDLWKLQLVPHGLRDMQFHDDMPDLHQHELHARQRRLRPVQLAVPGLHDLHLRRGLRDVRLGLHAGRVELRDVRLVPVGLRDLRLEDELHGLREHHLRGRGGQLLALHDGARGLPDLQQQLVVPELRHGVRPQRVGLRPVQRPHCGLHHVFLEDGLHGLRQQHLRAGELDVLPLQRGPGRVPLLQLGQRVPGLPAGLRAQRLHLRDLQQPDARVRQLQLGLGLLGLPEQQLRAVRQQLSDLQLAHGGVRDVQFHVQLPDLPGRLHHQRVDLCPL